MNCVECECVDIRTRGVRLIVILRSLQYIGWRLVRGEVVAIPAKI